MVLNAAEGQIYLLIVWRDVTIRAFSWRG